MTIVHSSELPEVDQWLAGGEVLLIIGTLQNLGDPSIAGYVERVHSAGAVALGVGLGSHLPHYQAPQALVQAASRVGLPLFTVPEAVPFVAVVEAFTRLRVSESAEEIAALVRTQRRFATDLAARGVQALLDEVSRVLNLPVAYASPTGRLLGVGSHSPSERAGARLPDTVRYELIVACVAGGFAPRLLKSAVPGEFACKSARSALEAIPVGTESIAGWLLAPLVSAQPGGGRQDARTLLLATAAALLALQDEDAPNRREIAAQLCAGTVSAAEVCAQLEELTGTEVPHRLGFATVDNMRASGVRGGVDDGDLQAREQRRLDLRLCEFASDVDLTVLCHVSAVGVALVCPWEYRGLVTVIARELRIGLSNWVECTAVDVHDLWHEWRFGSGDSRAHLTALLSTVNADLADDFVQRTLGPLLAHSDGGGLLRTLEVFAQVGGNRDVAASVLGVHRHTVRARLERVQSILGYDPREPRHLQAIGVAFLLRSTASSVKPKHSHPTNPPR